MRNPSLILGALALGCTTVVIEAPETDLDPALTEPLRFDAGEITPPVGTIDAAVALIDARVGTPDQAVGPAEDLGLPVDAAPPVDAEIDQAVPDMACVDEVCNGLDDDCDDAIDEGAGCPCPVAQVGDVPLLLCDQSLEWPAARDLCRTAGYDLVVLQAAEVDAFIYSEMQARGFGDTWIGLNDRQNEGHWVWLDGIPTGYTHWDGGEPNDGGSGEDCALIMTANGRQAEWDDRPCAQPHPFVCGITL
jgi:hypothetical protein